jgi:hypothetical protein
MIQLQFQAWLDINCLAFFTIDGSADNDEARVVSSSLSDHRVKVDDIKRLTSFTLPIRWMSIAPGVVARMMYTASIETKTDLERH